MTGWIGATLTMLVALNPFGVARAVAWTEHVHPSGPRPTTVTATAMVAALLVAVGLFATPVLEVLDVSTPTFMLAVAVVLGISGAKWMVAPTKPVTSVADQREATMTLTTLVLMPATVLASLGVNADSGTPEGIVATALAGVALVGLVSSPRIPEPVNEAVVRLLGAGAVVVAVAIGIDAARTV